MRAVTWALPAGVAAVRLGPVGTVLVAERLSPEERRVACVIATYEQRPFVAIPYSEVWRVARHAPLEEAS